MRVLVVLSVMCLTASAQTEYSGIAGASPNLVRAHERAVAKEGQHTVTARAEKKAPVAKNSTRLEKEKRTVAERDSGEVEVKEGLNTLSRGVGRVVRRELHSVGEVTRKIGDGGKKFFKKLGKGISDAFKKDSVKAHP